MSDKASFSQIDFVPAKAEDYEEVMSISGGIYNGLDYLPFRYHAWLKDPQRTMFLAKCEGKVVGFESFLLVDDGTTAVVEGLRVAPWMRGRGVAGLIQKHCLDILHSDHPEVKKVRLTRVENPPADMLAKYKVLNSKAVISINLPADQLETSLKLLESRVDNLDTSKNLSVLGAEEILKFFDESKTRKDLLAGGFLVQGWLPLTTQKPNLNLLLKRNIVWIYSHPRESSDLTTSSKVTASCGGPQAYLEGFLSLCTPPFSVPYSKGVKRLDIDMFGNDPSYAKLHVLKQLKMGAQGLPAGSGVICILYADESLRAQLDQFCEGLTPFPLVREQLLLEMDI
ncbi:probable N-acetyltransferase 16 isoform X1 [Engystomops pustulosus]|uniref:probable N-acetyltransferase 16 isoform X1 n=1 Tax=Engystomops pustulosus TaxID=76066 RepID=UPI003AFA97C3